jgi:hypothetical protein
MADGWQMHAGLPTGPSGMSTNPPSPPAAGPGSPGKPPRLVARAIFRDYYESLPDIPGGKLETDVAEVEARYVALAGYTRDEKNELARETRKALRERRKRPEPTDQSFLKTPAKWEVRLTRVGFGTYVLAAVGLFCYATTIEKWEPSWENLRPYVIGISGTAILLLLLTFGRAQIEKAGAPAWLGRCLVIALAFSFVIAVALVAVWFGALVLRDAIPPPAERPVWKVFQPSQLRYSSFPYDRRTTVTRQRGSPLRFELIEQRARPTTLHGIFVLFDPGESTIDAVIHTHGYKDLPVTFHREGTSFDASSLQLAE